MSCYLIDGREVELVAKLETGYLIADIYNPADGEECFIDSDRPRLVKTVYEKPPVAKYYAEIGELAQEIQVQKERKYALSKDIAALSDQIADQMKRLKQYEPLRNLDKFLLGELTHFVIVDYSAISVVTSEYLKSDDRHDESLKMLTLYGCADGALNWRVNQYSDGGGSTRECYPFCSYEEALEKAKSLLDEKIKETAKQPRRSVIENANALGVLMSRYYINAVIEMELKNENERLSKMQGERQKVEERIVALNIEKEGVNA